jgi:UDP-N-acetyl-D-mannosaminuronate dehydrogenase
MSSLVKETVLIIGLGEIGHTLFCLYNEKKADFEAFGIDLDKKKMQQLNQKTSNIPPKIDTLQVCLPCPNAEKFSEIITEYQKQHQPKLVIINSTVPPGTTLKVAEKCKCQIAHSPARGVHITPEHMLWEIKRWPKYVGGATPQATKTAKHHFEKLGLKVKTLKSCR